MKSSQVKGNTFCLGGFLLFINFAAISTSCLYLLQALLTCLQSNPIKYYNENKKYRFRRQARTARSDGGCNRSRIPLAMQRVRSRYGVYRICVERCPDSFGRKNHVKTEYQRCRTPGCHSDIWKRYRYHGGSSTYRRTGSSRYSGLELWLSGKTCSWQRSRFRNVAECSENAGNNQGCRRCRQDSGNGKNPSGLGCRTQDHR